MKKQFYLIAWFFAAIFSFLSPSSWGMDFNDNEMSYNTKERTQLIFSDKKEPSVQACPYYLGTCSACFEFSCADDENKDIADVYSLSTGKFVKLWKKSSFSNQCCFGSLCGAESILAGSLFFFAPDCMLNLVTQHTFQNFCIFQSAVTLWASPCLCQTALCLPGVACCVVNQCCTKVCSSSGSNESYLDGLKRGRSCKARGCFGNEVCLDKTIRCLDVSFCCAWLPCLSDDCSCVRSYMKSSIKLSQCLGERLGACEEASRRTGGFIPL